MATLIGSARHDENNRYKNGKAGDQKQKITLNGYDMSGEVSVQYLKDFIGSRKWYVLRPKQAAHAIAMAKTMKTICNNAHVGYNQNNRFGVVNKGSNTQTNTDSDCSSAVRECIKEGAKKDVGNFTTQNEKDVLEASGLFDKAIPYKTGMKIYEGDVLVTQTKGHTGICVEGEKRVKTPETFIYRGVDYSPVFNPTYYANKYKAKEPAFGTMTSTQLFEHFYTFGMKERRQACLTFNVDVYKERYEDLRSKFGDNYPAYYHHFCTHQHEKREGI